MFTNNITAIVEITEAYLVVSMGLNFSNNVFQAEFYNYHFQLVSALAQVESLSSNLDIW